MELGKLLLKLQLMHQFPNQENVYNVFSGSSKMCSPKTNNNIFTKNSRFLFPTNLTNQNLKIKKLKRSIYPIVHIFQIPLIKKIRSSRKQIISKQVKHPLHRPARRLRLRRRRQRADGDQRGPAEGTRQAVVVGQPPLKAVLVEHVAAVAELPHLAALPHGVQANGARRVLRRRRPPVLDLAERGEGEALSHYPQIGR